MWERNSSTKERRTYQTFPNVTGVNGTRVDWSKHTGLLENLSLYM